MKILVIGAGHSGSNIINRIAKENISEMSFLKVNYWLEGDEPISESIPLVNLNQNKATTYPTAWPPSGLRKDAEKAEDIIREAIKKGLELD